MRTYQRQPSQCSNVNCVTPAVTRGFCAAHYQRGRHNGLSFEETKLLPAVRRHGEKSDSPSCANESCDSPAIKTGLCDKHYSQKRYRERRATQPVSDNPNQNSDFVYLLTAPGWSPEGAHKIGRGSERSRANRLHSLRSALPTAEYVRQVRVEDAAALERWLHRHFWPQRIAGEWFTIDPISFDIAVNLYRIRKSR